MEQDGFNLPGNITLEGQQKVRQAREGFFTLGAEESLNPAPLLDSEVYGLTRTGAMSVNFSAAQGTKAEIILNTTV